MATENQIRANRANAAKSTGPITTEGKQASFQSAARCSLIAGTVVFRNESIRRFNDLASALTLQFQPRDSVEARLVQTITAARWRLLRMWGIQTAAFESEMAEPAKGESCRPSLRSHPRRHCVPQFGRYLSLALMHRFEIEYDRQFNRALTLAAEAPPGSRVRRPRNSG
jgi:hypothetical protein